MSVLVLLGDPVAMSRRASLATELGSSRRAVKKMRTDLARTS
jgi:hypothetical protein